MLRMDTPGISLRPIVQMTDEAGFNETFFEDVRVPAKNMIGEENRGWYVSATTLDFERSGINRMAEAVPIYNRLLEHSKQPDSAGAGRRVVDNPINRQHLADTHIEINVARLLGYRVSWMQSQDLVPNHESSISKLFGTELQQRNARRGINMLGLAGQLRPGSKHAPMGGELCYSYMATVSRTIAAGTSEIQRHIISRELLRPKGA